MLLPIDVLRIRKRLGREDWHAPRFFHGNVVIQNKLEQGRIFISVDFYPDPNNLDKEEEWVHVSLAFKERMPTYEEVKKVKLAVFGDQWAYQVFAPTKDHYNLHEHCLHLWGRVDGKAVLPDFTKGTGEV